MTASLGEWDETPDELDSQTRAEAEPPRLFYGSVDEFVRDHLRWVYRRRVGDRAQWRWAAQWWRYDEAVERLEALWRAWEHLRLDPALGMSVWWRDHADPHMTALLDPDGPFAGVEGEENVNKRGEPLPYQAPPAGLFPDVRQVPAVSPQPSPAAPESGWGVLRT